MNAMPRNSVSVETSQEKYPSKIDSLVKDISSCISVDVGFPLSNDTLPDQRAINVNDELEFIRYIQPFLNNMSIDYARLSEIELPNNFGYMKFHSNAENPTLNGYVSSLLLALAVSEVQIEITESQKSLKDVPNWENASVEDLTSSLDMGSVDREETLGDIVDEVYPVFNEYRKDVMEALELAFTDKEEFFQRFFKEERENIDYQIKRLLLTGGVGTEYSSRRSAMYRILVTSIAAYMALAGCVAQGAEGIPVSSSRTADPVPATDTLEPTEIPTSTSTPSSTPTEIPTRTPTKTPTITLTPQPTSTMHPARATAYGPDHPIMPYNDNRTFFEELEKFEYALSNFDYSYERGELPMTGLGVIIRDFTSEGVEVRADGDFVVGTIEYLGEEYRIEAKLDYNNNSARIYGGGGTGHFYTDRDDALDRITEGRSHIQIVLWIMDVEGRLGEAGRPLSFAKGRGTYTLDEWIEIRSVIGEMIRGEVSPSEYYFILARLF